MGKEAIISKPIDFNQRILVSMTGKDGFLWQKQLAEIIKLNITEVALFLENISLSQREMLYPSLLKSEIKSIPLIHLRNDMSKDEIDFLVKKYHSKFLTIHENDFDNLERW